MRNTPLTARIFLFDASGMPQATSPEPESARGMAFYKLFKKATRSWRWEGERDEKLNV